MAGRPKGLPKTGGRAKGTCNGDVAKLRGLILNALDKAGGEEYLYQQSIENPAQFLTLIGKVLPKDVNVGGQPDNPVEHKVSLAPVLTPEQWMQAFGPK